MRMRQLVVTILAAAGLAWSATAVSAELAIVDARIYVSPEAEAIERGTVLVRDGRIATVDRTEAIDVPGDAVVIDAEGRTLVAGFWNSHVHFLGPQFRAAATQAADELDAALEIALTRWGFTTVFDISSFGDIPAALRERIESGELRGPQILHVGTPFFPGDGTPIYVRDLLKEIGAPSAEVFDANRARDRARRQLAAGADGVKLFTGAIVGGEIGVLPMDIDIARAVVEEAHRAGKPAFAHPSNTAGLEVAIASGVDILAHTAPAAGPWDEDMVRRLREANIALVPSLALFEYELRRENAPDDITAKVIAHALQQLRVFSDAGGNVLFGTDADYMPHYDTQREIELMSRAGLGWRDILATLTTAPAARFGQDARKGRIATGMDADLVLLDSDPAGDVTALGNVHATIREGKVIYRTN